MIPGYLRRGTWVRLKLLCLGLLLCFAILPLAAQENGSSASLHGTIRNSQGKPVTNASVWLKGKNSTNSKSASTDEKGYYTFSGLSPGVYSVHAVKSGSGDAEITSVFLNAHEDKNVDLAISLSAAGAPQFFDEPQFSVSGVTDTTSLGGHGSDTVVRTRDSIAKDTTTLGKADSAPPVMVPEIDQSLRAGNYAGARDEVRRLLAQQDTASLHHLLGSIDEKLSDSLDAVHEYQHAAQMEPTEPYIFDWGSELLLHHAPEPAAEVFDKGTNLFPKSTRMWIGLGAASFARGSNEQAVRQVCTASDLNPSDPAPYLFLGKMQHAEKNSSNEVLEKLHRFVTLQPQNAQANYYYAVALWKNRDPQDKSRAAQVESLLANSIRLDPKFAEAELQLGIVYADQGDAAAAIPHYQRAIEIAPETEEGHFRLAQAYRHVGEPEKSKEELQLYQQLSKKSSETLERERHEIRQFVYTLRDQQPSRVQ
jgi:tetratricopeptide (TPR) repeat protein